MRVLMNRTAIAFFWLNVSLIAPLISRAADPAPKDSVVVRLDDMRDFSQGQTLELRADGGLCVRTISEDNERVNRIKLSSGRLKSLFAFIPASGILVYRERERSGEPNEVHTKITLTLPKQDKLVVQKWANDRAPQFDKLYERLLELAKSTVKERTRILTKQAEVIRTARKVVAEEFAGYHRDRRRTLNTSAMGGPDLDDLANIVKGPELAEQPAIEEQYGCFDPHHSFLVTNRDGKSYRIVVCLGCHRIVFQRRQDGASFPFTGAARGRLRALFQRLNLPTRTSEEYSRLDFDERQRAK